MNILLNNFCNLNCEYCFANDVRKENKKEMSLGDFDWLLDFLKRSGNKEVRLIGGEPTLHSKFLDIYLKASQRDFVNRIHTFTNGTYPFRYNELFYLVSKKKEISFLINLNSEEVIGSKKYKHIERNIQVLSEMKRVNITLGINFYKKNQDYTYILDLADKYNIKSIRWSLVVPNTEEKKKSNIKQYFGDHKSVILDFIRDSVKRRLKPHVDCNNIPICFLDDEDLRLIAMISERNLKTSICNPVVDIKPDMKAIRCFIMGDYSVDIGDFNNLKELKNHFEDKVDNLYNKKPLFEECEKCASYQLRDRSCTCLAFHDIGRDTIE